jgi:hypothetical protein
VKTRDLQNHILQRCTQPHDTVDDINLQSWYDIVAITTPIQTSAAKQLSWDQPMVERELADLFQRQLDDYNKARLLAASAKHSADWLHALPITSCGLRLDNDAIRVAVALRLGADVCEPHTCRCGAKVDVRGSHALSCKRSSGRIIRHNYLNDIILRSFTRAGIPASREPNGLLRTDGKRPDGLTLTPWREGHCLVWDVTVADTTASSYLPVTAVTAGSAAESAAARKETKYAELSNRYVFVPIAIESHGPFNNKALLFLKELGRRITITSSDSRETSFLYQRLSVALQRFNAICLYDTFPVVDDVGCS